MNPPQWLPHFHARYLHGERLHEENRAVSRDPAFLLAAIRSKEQETAFTPDHTSAATLQDHWCERQKEIRLIGNFPTTGHRKCNKIAPNHVGETKPAR